jgi:hypothetical protein
VQGLPPRARHETDGDKPRTLSKSARTQAEKRSHTGGAIWIIKHGVKTTGMPAWGITHDDELLWDVVAFLRKLPELTAEQYQALVKSAPTHEEMMHDMEMGTDHDHSDHAD